MSEKTVPETGSTRHDDPGKKRRLLISLGVVGALVAVLAVAGVWYALHYSDRALPRTTVAGHSISGYTRAQVSETLAQLVSDTRLNIDGDAGAHSASFEDLSVSIDQEAVTDDVFSPNPSIYQRFQALWKPRDVQVTADVERVAVENYIETIMPDDVVATQNAQLHLNDDGETFSWTAGTVGQTLPADEIIQATEEAVSTLQDQDLTLGYVDQIPDITDEDAERLVAEAGTLSTLPVTITYDGEEYSPRLTTRTTWVDLTPTDEGTLTVNSDVVTEWVQKAADDFVNTEPVTGTRKVSSDGEVLQVVKQASEGRTVTNVSDISNAVVSALNNREEYTGEFAVEIAEEPWNDEDVAPGAENLYYKASPGEKWIDINLSNRTTTGYEGATPVIGPVYMVPGKPGFETVTGLFSVYLKYESQTMRGDNGDGTRYETPGVPWILYFHGGYALHGAYWRSSFGPGAPGGSHGCINLPVSTAKTFYDWAPNGTVVGSHY